MRKILVAALLLPVWLLLGEAAARAVLALDGRPYSTAEARERSRLTVETIVRSVARQPAAAGPTDAAVLAEKRALHPYFGWWAGDAEAWWTYARSFRAGAVDSERVAFVVVVGGSVAAATFRYEEAAFRDAVDGHAGYDGRRLVILTLARGGWKQPQQLNLVTFLLGSGLEPAVVVNVDGFNEVALGYDNYALGVCPTYPNWPQWSAIAPAMTVSPAMMALRSEAGDLAAEAADLWSTASRLRLYESAVLGTLVERRFGPVRAKWAELQEKYLRIASATEALRDLTGPVAEDEDEALDLIVRCWEQSSLSLFDVCSSRGIRYLHVLQPTLHDPGAKPVTEEERRKGAIGPAWKRGVELGYPRLREAGARLQARGVAFLDASRVFASHPETTYFDACHFRGEGLRMFSQRIGRATAEVLAGGMPEPLVAEAPPPGD